MKINEYKNEVKSLTLSDGFKAQLKENMLKAYNENADSPETDPEKKIEASGSKFNKKYSKYLALAACALLAVSTVSAVTLGGLRSKLDRQKVSDIISDDPGSETDDPPESLNSIAQDLGADDAEEPQQDVSGVVEEPDIQPDDEPDYGPDAPTQPETVAPKSESEPDETEAAGISEDAPTVIPTTGNGYSYGKSSDYDGDYDGEDYTLDLDIGSASNIAGYVTDSDGISHSLTNITPAAFDIAQNTDTPADAPEAPEAPRVPDDFDEETDEENPAFTGREWNMEDDEAIDSVFEMMTQEFSYKYYDIRDGVIADLSEVGLIRFNIEDVYETKEDISKNIVNDVNIDLNSQAMYRVNISRDYFNGEETDVDYLLINSGNSDTQLYGRPLMEGEYISVVYLNKDRILEPIPQLIYAVHRVNGVDLAYHVYSEDGFMVDPGDTNIGLNPEERWVVTSTVNNPEIYTQKAVVKELTYYLKRNIARMGIDYINVKDLNAEANSRPQESSQPEDSGEQSGEAEQTLRTGLRARFPTGYLISETDSINGIRVGDTLEDALEAFYLTKYSFAPDCTITLIASEEQGGWYVDVTFENGVVTKIEPHIT